MQLARAASLTIASRQTAASNSSFVINRPACSTMCRRTANALGISASGCSPHHARSSAASIRTGGRLPPGAGFTPRPSQSLGFPPNNLRVCPRRPSTAAVSLLCPRWLDEAGTPPRCSGSRAARSRSPTRTRCSSPSRDTPSSTSCATTSPWPTARCAAPAAGPTCWCAIPTASAASSSTRSARRPRAALDRGGVAPLPLGTERRGGGAARRGRARLARQPRLPRAAPASGPRRRPRPSRRAARGSRPGAGRGVGAGARGGARGRGDAPRLRAHRLAQDLGLARDARHRAHRAALELRRGAARGAGARARGRAARAAARHQQVVEGGAARRVRGLQPERQGPHRRVGVLGAADARRARLGAAQLGRGRQLRAGRLHAGDDAGALRRGRRSARGDRRPRRLARRAARAVGAARAEGLGDAPWPPHYKKQRGEPPRCSRPGAACRSIR